MSLVTADPRAAEPDETALPFKGRVAVVIGNWLEFYDFLVYTFFAVMIADAFFPGESEIERLLGALATFGAGFLTRPLGAAMIGAYADRVGRRAALTLTLMLMAVGSGLVALTPPYAQIGLAAPIILVIARLIQGFSAGGEVGAATTYLLESAPSREACRQHSLAGSQPAARRVHGQPHWGRPRLQLVEGSVVRVGLASPVPAGGARCTGWPVHPPPAPGNHRAASVASVRPRRTHRARATSCAQHHPGHPDHLRRYCIDVCVQLHDHVTRSRRSISPPRSAPR